MAGDEDPSTIVASRTISGRDPAAERLQHTALTIEWHYDLRRVGESSPLHGSVTEISRRTPPFDNGNDVLLSRTPFLIVDDRPEGLELHPGVAPTLVEVEGTRLVGSRPVSPDQLEAGVMITLADALVVCLHRLRTPVLRGPSFGLVGGSDAIEGVRRQINNVADLDVPVLIRGETGTGKELVARALATGRTRTPGPFIAVNMATVPANTAADELFGHDRGAFTGASESRPGYFVEADGGTLFLDEIGVLSPEVQTMLLRVLEDGEVRPLGSKRRRKVNVRVLAATDANLEHLVREGRFVEPLLHRLARYQISLPPLRARRADIGPLFLHFLRKALAIVGDGDRLGSNAVTDRPWLEARDFARVARSALSGNIRTIINITHQLAISSHGHPYATLDEAFEGLLGTVGKEPPSIGSQPDKTVDDEEVSAAFRDHNYNVAATAAALGIHRSSLYEWIRRNPGAVRPAAELNDSELLSSYERHRGSIAAMANELRVSPKPLKKRLSEALRRR